MNPDKSIAVVIAFNQLKRDPRVNRQLEMLKHYFYVVAVGYDEPSSECDHFIQIERTSPGGILRRAYYLFLIAFRLFEKFYWRGLQIKQAKIALSSLSPDLVVVNDINPMPLVCEVFPKAHIVLDCHEYTPKEYEDQFLWRLVFQRYKTFLCQKYLARADVSFTVCDGIRDLYLTHFGVDTKLLLNCPKYFNLEAKKTDPFQIKMIHHGIASRSRHLELMIETMKLLDQRFTLDLMLMPDSGGYYEELKELAANNPRVRFREPVNMIDIPVALNDYDVGICMVPPVNTNYRFGLPNKFFEFIQGRIAVAIGPSIEMVKILKTDDLGIVSEDFSPGSMAKALSSLSADQIDKFKKNSHLAANKYSLESNAKIFLESVSSLKKVS